MPNREPDLLAEEFERLERRVAARSSARFNNLPNFCGFPQVDWSKVDPTYGGPSDAECIAMWDGFLPFISGRTLRDYCATLANLPSFSLCALRFDDAKGESNLSRACRAAP